MLMTFAFLAAIAPINRCTVTRTQEAWLKAAGANALVTQVIS